MLPCVLPALWYRSRAPICMTRDMGSGGVANIFTGEMLAVPLDLSDASSGGVPSTLCLQCVAVCCSVLQCVAVRCSVIDLSDASSGRVPSTLCLQYGAVCCSVLQCVAVSFSVFAVCCSVIDFSLQTQSTSSTLCLQ